MTYEEIIKNLKSKSNAKNVEGMAKYGITPKSIILGISIWELRKLKKNIGVDHQLAQKLWATGIHEARILASFIEDSQKVTEKQLDSWVKDFDSWDIVDQVSELIAHTPYVVKKIHEWSNRKEEFVKRTAFSLIAEIAWWDKKMGNKDFEQFYPIIKRASTDERNYVRKAVNWALRNIGKRNKNLNKQAINLAKEIEKIDNKTSRWIAKDALRELTSEKIQSRFK